MSVAAGTCFVYDMASTLRIRMLEGQFVGLVIPRYLLEEVSGRSTVMHGLTLQADGPHARILGPMLTALVDQAGRLSDATAEVYGAALINIIAGSIERPECASRSNQQKLQSDSVGLSIATSARLRRYIDRHAADPTFTPEVLAEAFDLSRATLYRRFQEEGGVASAIRARRAALARNALAARDGSKRIPLLMVARASGFQNVAEMRRGLHAVYGATPSKLQKTMRGLVVPGPTHEPDSLAIGALYDDMP